ncbi:MAG: hypothetical protein GXX01_01020 [Clostridiales bacterium]|jgi:hypothetical protein|nr:hypothetical protein [Clostridiales bacterium]
MMTRDKDLISGLIRILNILASYQQELKNPLFRQSLKKHIEEFDNPGFTKIVEHAIDAIIS